MSGYSLFSRSHLAPTLYSAAVAISIAVMLKLPSPSISMHSFSGVASLAPITAGTPNPMVPSPPEVTTDRGSRQR